MRNNAVGLISMLCLSILPLATRADGISQKGTSWRIERATQRGDEAALLKLRASLGAGHPDKYRYYYLCGHVRGRTSASV